MSEGDYNIISCVGLDERTTTKFLRVGALIARGFGKVARHLGPPTGLRIALAKCIAAWIRNKSNATGATDANNTVGKPVEELK